MTLTGSDHQEVGLLQPKTFLNLIRCRKLCANITNVISVLSCVGMTRLAGEAGDRLVM